MGPKRRWLLNQSTQRSVAIFDSREARPGPLAPDDLGLEQAIDRLGEGIVIGVPDAADRGHQLRLRQALGVAHGEYCEPLSE